MKIKTSNKNNVIDITTRKNLSCNRWDMKELDENGFTVIDLFCGAGVGAVGLKLAGFKTVYALDNNKYAVETYNKNIDNVAVVGDIRKIRPEDIPDADIITGGFPCQPFSLAGNGNGVNDRSKGDLGYHFYKVIKNKQPKLFFMENVDGIINKKHRPFFLALMKLFEGAGYNVYYKKNDLLEPVAVNSHDYGVAQLRKRIFVVGVRKDLDIDFKFPDEVSEEEKRDIRYAIGDLPSPDSKVNFEIKNQDKYYDDGYSPRYKSRNRQKQWNEPSYTIVSSARQLPLYPEPANFDIRYDCIEGAVIPRRFTVRECLRLQTVPDWFYFDDNVPLSKQYERCSGIPSLISYKFGVEMAKLLSIKSKQLLTKYS